MAKLEGRVAVITGGNSGLGLATAQRLAAEEAYVFITGRRQSELDLAARQIGKNVTGVQGDVSRLADLDRLYATVSRGKARSTFCSPTQAPEKLPLLERSPRTTPAMNQRTFEGCFRYPQTACFSRVTLEGDLSLRTMRDCWRKRGRD